ncbi:hypothetical protein BDN67DRAFT_685475 [Paxillus ammoniavirescens]|nr:hypothetical protein BDN67DRAFT_685475 [Paxillus ammoniavirescens]
MENELRVKRRCSQSAWPGLQYCLRPCHFQHSPAPSRPSTTRLIQLLWPSLSAAHLLAWNSNSLTTKIASNIAISNLMLKTWIGSPGSQRVQGKRITPSSASVIESPRSPYRHRHHRAGNLMLFLTWTNGGEQSRWAIRTRLFLPRLHYDGITSYDSCASSLLILPPAVLCPFQSPSNQVPGHWNFPHQPPRRMACCRSFVRLWCLHTGRERVPIPARLHHHSSLGISRVGIQDARYPLRWTCMELDV